MASGLLPLPQGGQWRRGGRQHHKHREVRAVGGAHHRIAVDGVAARVVLLQRGIEQRHERGIRRMHLVLAQQFQRLGQRQAPAPGDLRQGFVEFRTHARHAGTERELRLQRDLVVQCAEALGEGLLPGLRIRDAALHLRILRPRMHLVLQVQRRLRGRVVAQRADRFDGVDGLRILPGHLLQAEQRGEVTRPVFVAIDGHRLVRERRHRAIEACALQAGGYAHVLRLHEGRPREQRQQQPPQAAHRLTASAA